jgi:SNF2 family DNA or RNA helicase
MSWFFPELPARVKEALLRLATDDRIKELETMLRGQLKVANAEEDDEDSPLDSDVSIPTAVNWEEGTEDLNKKTMDELWSMLGLGEIKAIPGFNSRIDPDGAHNPWDKTDKQWFDDPKNGKEFELRSHQLVGIVRMAQMAFITGKHCLLADEVGLGKTAQVIGLACVLRFFRDYYLEHQKFPGEFGE